MIGGINQVVEFGMFDDRGTLSDGRSLIFSRVLPTRLTAHANLQGLLTDAHQVIIQFGDADGITTAKPHMIKKARPSSSKNRKGSICLVEDASASLVAFTKGPRGLSLIAKAKQAGEGEE
jgi:uncharacterized DUF497 family protein